MQHRDSGLRGEAAKVAGAVGQIGLERQRAPTALGLGYDDAAACAQAGARGRVHMGRFITLILVASFVAACSGSAAATATEATVSSSAPTLSPTPSASVTPPATPAPTQAPTPTPVAASVVQIVFGYVRSASNHNDWFAVGVRKDGGISEWGTAAPPAPAGLGHVVSVAVSGWYVMALREDGTLAVWTTYGSIPIAIPAALAGVKAIAPLPSLGSDNKPGFLAVKSDGSTVAFGNDYAGDTKVPKGITGVVAVAAAAGEPLVAPSSIVLALRSDGTVAGWGNWSVFGGTMTTIARWVKQFRGATAVASSIDGDAFAVADGSGKVVWQLGQAGGSVPIKDVTQLALGMCYGLALTKDGTVKGWTGGCSGDLTPTQQAATPPAGLSDVVFIFTGLNTTSGAIKSDGSLVVWGGDSVVHLTGADLSARP